MISKNFLNKEEGSGLNRLLPNSPGTNIKEFLVTILSEAKRPQIQCLSPKGEFWVCSGANFRIVKNSFQRAKGDLGNNSLRCYIPPLAQGLNEILDRSLQVMADPIGELTFGAAYVQWAANRGLGHVGVHTRSQGYFTLGKEITEDFRHF